MSNFNSAASFIEEIKADFRKYVDAGLVDEASMYRDLEIALKKFGNNINELNETVIEVENGKAILPDNFSSLYIAYLCEPLGYTTKVKKEHLQDSNFFIERTERKYNWKSCDPCCIDEEEKVITEKLYFEEHEVDFHYKNPTLLKLGKTFNKNACHDKCRNKYVRESLSEIIINRKVLHANFDCGHIYLQYYGLPIDDEGNLVITETFNGELESYLEYYLKERLVERLMSNGDAGQGLSSLYSVFASKRSTQLRLAMNSLKMCDINPDRLRRRWRKLNTMEALKYSLSFNHMDSYGYENVKRNTGYGLH